MSEWLDVLKQLKEVKLETLYLLKGIYKQNIKLVKQNIKLEKEIKKLKNKIKWQR